LRIALLNNLRAGRSDAQVSRLLGFLRQHPDVLHVETDSAYAMPEALADLARQEVDVLAVNGGDGTLQHALTEILDGHAFGDSVPMIAPLRGGRTNMTALDLGTQSDPLRSMARLIEATREGTLESLVRPRNVIRVEFGPGRRVEYGMFLGLGMIHRAIELTHRVFPRGRSQGVLGSTLVTAALVSRAALLRNTDGVLTPDKVQVLLDGKMLEQGEFLLSIASTLGRLFSRMRPFWGAGSGSLRFTFVSPKAHRPWRAVLPILRGKTNEIVCEENGYVSRNVDRADLRFDCGFTLDGELFAAEPGRTAAVSADRRVRFLEL